jgi:Heterodisulfide reductase, subunit A and related polyferredoxins
MIIGGGVCGMEAAARLSRLGLHTVLIEEKESLGGHVSQWDRLFPKGKPAVEILNPLYEGLDKTETLLSTTVSQVEQENGHYTLTLSDGSVYEAGAVLIATGFSQFKAQRKEEYGYGIYDHVMSSANLETSFKMEKELGSKSDKPLKIGFVHCVGSRDEKVCNRYCSKVCCATAVKQAGELKEMHPKAQIFCFYMDLRMFGRGYEDLYLQAQNKYGIQFIRGRVSEVAEDIDRKLIVKAEDTLAGRPLRLSLDYLVLMSGMEPHSSTQQIASMFNIPLSEDGFYQGLDAYLSHQLSEQQGLFFAGACTGPKTLIDTLGEARAAALAIYEYIRSHD